MSDRILITALALLVVITLLVVSVITRVWAYPGGALSVLLALLAVSALWRWERQT